ncbi:MAG: hypothetical protein GX663_10345 [Clostridiales bacterium]|nr:hypothetical protein [Clostridiales bacterium]
MRKFLGTVVFIFLIILATAGLAAFVMQNAFQEPITFKEFFEMISNG